MKMWQNCEFLSIFLTKEDLNKYIKLLCKMKLWGELWKEAIAGRCSVKKFTKFTKFTGKHLCWSFFFKVTDLRPKTLFKKRLQHRCFQVSFLEFFKNTFLKNPSGGCFCIKDLFLSKFCNEKSFKQIFFNLLV